MLHRTILSTSLLALWAASALASPTARDWEVCHKHAASALQGCLDRQPGYRDDGSCWSQAREVKDACYDHVVQTYAEPPESERRARQEADLAAKAEAERAARAEAERRRNAR